MGKLTATNYISRFTSSLTLMATSVIVLVLTACAGGGPAGQETSEQTNQTGQQSTPLQLTLGAPPSSSGHYPFFVAVSQLINAKVDGINATVRETGTGADGITEMVALGEGNIDMGLGSNINAYDIYHGEGRWNKTDGYKNVRYFSAYSVIPTALVVRADSDIQFVSDLQGRKFSAGTQGSITEQMTLRALKALDVTIQPFTGTPGDILRAFTDGRIEGFALNMASPSTPVAGLLQVASQVDVRLISFSDDEFAKVQAAYPRFAAWYVEPGALKNKERVGPLLGMVGALNTTDKLSEEAGYNIFAAMVADQKAEKMLANGFKAVSEIDLVETTLKSAEIPLHAGVVRYLEEHGHKVPADVIPPEYKKK